MKVQCRPLWLCSVRGLPRRERGEAALALGKALEYLSQDGKAVSQFYTIDLCETDSSGFPLRKRDIQP